MLNFGDYVQAHEPVDPTNRNEVRTVGTIALYPSGNGQGSWYIMSLVTGEGIHKYEWKVINVAQETINRVHALAKQQGMLRVNGNFTYKSTVGVEIVYDEKEGELLTLWKIMAIMIMAMMKVII